MPRMRDGLDLVPTVRAPHDEPHARRNRVARAASEDPIRISLAAIDRLGREAEKGAGLFVVEPDLHATAEAGRRSSSGTGLYGISATRCRPSTKIAARATIISGM